MILKVDKEWEGGQYLNYLLGLKIIFHPRGICIIIYRKAIIS